MDPLRNCSLGKAPLHTKTDYRNYVGLCLSQFRLRCPYVAVTSSQPRHHHHRRRRRHIIIVIVVNIIVIVVIVVVVVVRVSGDRRLLLLHITVLNGPMYTTTSLPQKQQPNAHQPLPDIQSKSQPLVQNVLREPTFPRAHLASLRRSRGSKTFYIKHIKRRIPRISEPDG